MSILSSTNTGKTALSINRKNLIANGYIEYMLVDIDSDDPLYINNNVVILLKNKNHHGMFDMHYVVKVHDKAYGVSEMRRHDESQNYQSYDIYYIRLESMKQLKMIEDYYNNNNSKYTFEDIIKYSLENKYSMYCRKKECVFKNIVCYAYKKDI